MANTHIRVQVGEGLRAWLDEQAAASWTSISDFIRHTLVEKSGRPELAFEDRRKFNSPRRQDARALLAIKEEVLARPELAEAFGRALLEVRESDAQPTRADGG